MEPGLSLSQLLLIPLFLLGVITFFTYLMSGIVSKTIHKLYAFIFGKREVKRSRKEAVVQPLLSQKEIEERKTASRKLMQESHTEKAASYEDRILKPRQDALEKKKREEFYRFSGPAWKGEGYKLDDDSEQSNKTGLKKRLIGTSRDAAKSRKLPEVVNKITSNTPPNDQKPKSKKVVVLPEEPPVGTSKCITIALRSTLGRVYKRRFLYTDNIQILLDYMTQLGYHPKIYRISSLYPRKYLTNESFGSFEEFGFTKDTYLYIEAKEGLEEHKISSDK